VRSLCLSPCVSLAAPAIAFPLCQLLLSSLSSSSRSPCWAPSSIHSSCYKGPKRPRGWDICVHVLLGVVGLNSGANPSYLLVRSALIESLWVSKGLGQNSVSSPRSIFIPRTHSLGVLPYPHSSIFIQDIVCISLPLFLTLIQVSSPRASCLSASFDQTSPLTLYHVHIVLSLFLLLLTHLYPHCTVVLCRSSPLVCIALSSFPTLS
jgi:hypothetical protein